MATYTANSSATMISAAAAAVAGDLINVTGTFAAASTGTVLDIATGVEIHGNSNTVTGFVWRSDGGASGQYVTTSNWHDITLNVTGAFNAGELASVVLKRGKFAVTDVTITGLSGGGTANGKSIAVMDTSTARCEATLTRVTIPNSSSDCASTNAISGTSSPASFLKLYNCTLQNPGVNAADNCLTSHNNFPIYAYDCTINTPGGGPIVNSAPVNSTLELYRCAIGVSGSTEIHCTKIVGCTITGTSSGNVVLHGDSLKSTESSIAAFNTLSVGMTLFNTDLVNSPEIYKNTFNVDDKGIAYSSASNITSTMARNTFNGPKTLNAFAMRPRGNGTSYIHNNTINIPAAPSASVYPVWAETPTSGTNTVEVRRCLINSAGRTINYATRGDAANSLIALVETITTCGTAIFFDGSAPNSTSTNSTTNGTNPNSYEVGAGFICNELKVLPAYGLEGWLDATTPLDDINKYDGLFPPTTVSVTANSPTQCTVSYTNANSVSRDHRIERATDSGFTTGLTSFDVSSVASGAATYVDTTCLSSTTYYYRVRAKNTTALSIASSSSNATTLNPAGALSVTLADDTLVATGTVTSPSSGSGRVFLASSKIFLGSSS